MRKSILLFSLIAALTLTVKSQSIKIYNFNGSQEITDDTLTFWHAVDPSIIEGPFGHSKFAKIYNATAGAMDIDLKRIVVDSIPGTNDLACWGQNCYGPSYPGITPVWTINDPVSASAMDTAKGLIGDFVIYFEANDQTGTGKYEYQFYSTEDPSVNGSVYIKWSISLVTDINEISAALKAMDVYPNPAKDNFTVDLNTGIKADHQEIIIRDMLGKIVRRENIPSAQETFRFTTEGMRGGIYFVSYAIDGEILKTNKLVVR